jgi:cytochrome P450
MDAGQRRAAFAALEPKVWLEQSIFSTLVVADAAIVAKVMRDSNFVKPDIPSVAREISQRHGSPLARVQATVDVLPLFFEGEKHMRLRKVLAAFLAAKLKEMEPDLPRIVGNLIAALPDSGEVDFVEQLIAPFTRDVFSRLAGKDLTDDIMSLTLINIFDGKHSPISLSRMEGMLEKVFAFFEALGEDDDGFICRLCCLVFGLDNMLSTLSENVAAAFQASNGVTPAELPAYPAEVMIAATYRLPLAATEFAGHTVPKGMLVRLQLAPAGYSADRSLTAALFGVGRHACIGKQLSLAMWKHLTEQFNARAFRGRITQYRHHSTHSFNFIQELRVALAP